MFESRMNRKIFSIVNPSCLLFLSLSPSSFIETPNQPVPVERKDRILHTTKTANEPVITIKGDYGQGTPADQHLYTTRGATVSDVEKKS